KKPYLFWPSLEYIKMKERKQISTRLLYVFQVFVYKILGSQTKTIKNLKFNRFHKYYLIRRFNNFCYFYNLTNTPNLIKPQKFLLMGQTFANYLAKEKIIEDIKKKAQEKKLYNFEYFT